MRVARLVIRSPDYEAAGKPWLATTTFGRLPECTAGDCPAPALDDPRHAAFTEEVKLEPFARALRETAPKVWFTALRATDTAVRAQMDPVSINPDGLIKVAPLLHWTSKDLYHYCELHGLPNNFDYVDPTKGEDNRECGLHLAH